MSADAAPVGWLACPECGSDAIKNTGTFCETCGGDRRCDDGCTGKRGPGWTEDDGGKCPECGIILRVAVDDERAYAVETEETEA